MDTPNSMTFDEIYAGLDDIWYQFSSDPRGNIEMWGNPAGLESLVGTFSNSPEPRKSLATMLITRWSTVMAHQSPGRSSPSAWLIVGHPPSNEALLPTAWALEAADSLARWPQLL